MSSKSFYVLNFIGEIILYNYTSDLDSGDIIIYLKQDLNETIPPAFSGCSGESYIECDSGKYSQILKSIEKSEYYKLFQSLNFAEIVTLFWYFEFTHYTIEDNSVDIFMTYIKQLKQSAEHLQLTQTNETDKEKIYEIIQQLNDIILEATQIISIKNKFLNECKSYDKIKTKHKSIFDEISKRYKTIYKSGKQLMDTLYGYDDSINMNILLFFEEDNDYSGVYKDHIYNSPQFTERLIRDKYKSYIPMDYERDATSNYCHKIKMEIPPLIENFKYEPSKAPEVIAEGNESLYDRLYELNVDYNYDNDVREIMKDFNIKTEEEFQSIFDRFEQRREEWGTRYEQEAKKHKELLFTQLTWSNMTNPKQIKIIKKLGGGTFGSVYMGICDGKKYAIKFMTTRLDEMYRKMMYYSTLLCHLYETNADIKTITDAPIINWVGSSKELFNIDKNQNNGIYALIMEMADRTLQPVIDESTSYTTSDERIKNKTLMSIIYNLGNDLIKVFNSIHNIKPFMQKNKYTESDIGSRYSPESLLYIDLKPGNIMLDTNNKIKLIDIDAFYSNRDDVNNIGTHLWSILCPTCSGVVHCDDYEILLLNMIDLAAGIDITKVKIENTKVNIYNARKKILDDLLIGIKNKKKPNYLDQFIKSLITLIYKMRTPERKFSVEDCEFKDKFKAILARFKLDMNKHTKRVSMRRSSSSSSPRSRRSSLSSSPRRRRRSSGSSSKSRRSA